MFGIVGHHDQFVGDGRGTDQQVKIIHRCSRQLQPGFFPCIQIQGMKDGQYLHPGQEMIQRLSVLFNLAAFLNTKLQFGKGNL